MDSQRLVRPTRSLEFASPAKNKFTSLNFVTLRNKFFHFLRNENGEIRVVFFRSTFFNPDKNIVRPTHIIGRWYVLKVSCRRLAKSQRSALAENYSFNLPTNAPRIDFLTFEYRVKS